jgi:copper(I)-binding protein
MSLKLPLSRTAVLLLLLTAGCGRREGGRGVVVEDAWARPMLVAFGGESARPGTNSAVYLHLRNLGRDLDRLLEAGSSAAERVEIHESVLDGDVMRMHRVDGVDLPPGETVVLAPGGLHIMLLDLRHSLLTGDTLALTLTFRSASPLSVAVPVRRGF